MKINIKKLRINKMLRVVFIITALLAICVISFLLYSEVKIPKTTEEKITLYSYTHKSSTDYKVHLKSNSLYNTSEMGEGQYYITNYVDTIEAAFNYEFSGERNADIKSYYEVAAVVEGYTIQEKEHITIWKRKSVLSPKEEFAVKDKVLTLTKSVNIKLSEYNDFVEAIEEESKVEIPTQLNVYMEVNLRADTGQGLTEAIMTPSITVPLNVKYFMITESEAKEEPGSIEETRKVQLPPDKRKVKVYICALSILFVALLGLLVFTKAAEKSRFTKQLNKIFKQHGSRLVALDSKLLDVSLNNCNFVRSIDDLVRVADEIGRPIMYEYSEKYEGMVHFYVLDDERTYMYILRDNMIVSNASATDGKEVAL